METAEVKIRILKQDNGRYPVEITVDGERDFPRGYLDVNSKPPNPVDKIFTDANYGQQLFSWFFRDQLLENWAEIRGAYGTRRVRLQIDADAPELHQVAWEALCEPAQEQRPKSFLAVALGR